MISTTTIIIWIAYFISLYVIVFWLLVFLDDKTEEKKKRLRHYPNVTIVIPAYNEGSRNLGETVESALELNYPRDKLEIIAVNHGSSDNTGDIINSYEGIKHSVFPAKVNEELPRVLVGGKDCKQPYRLALSYALLLQQHALYCLS